MNAELRRMAELAGFETDPGFKHVGEEMAKLEAFAKLVAEDIAQLCDEKYDLEPCEIYIGLLL